MTPQQRILNKCKEVIEKAKTLYGVDLSVAHISFNLKGRSAGWASWKRRNNITTYGVKFNFDMISRGDEEALRDMEEDTVPHEYAHIVCFMKPELGRNHDYGWIRVCKALGGTGKRTHDTDIVYGKGTTYEYHTSNGKTVRLNDRHHAYIQSGQTIRLKRDLGSVHSGCAYSIVGVRGRTLEQPVRQQPMNHPAQIENAIRAVPTPTATTQRPNQIPVPTPTVVNTHAVAGESKAATSRRIMLAGYKAGKSYETIITEMIATNGYDRQLARATFKANAPKIGIPATFY